MEEMKIKVRFEALYTDGTKDAIDVDYNTKEEAEEEIKMFQNDKDPFDTGKCVMMASTIVL